MTELVRYDAMCRAIDAAYEVDEVKDIRDKAIALETYMRLAGNEEAEQKAKEIRIRAERKAGELLKTIAKATGRFGSAGGRSEEPPPKTLADYGISKHQSSRWQRLADIPADQFERELASPDASTTGILSKTADVADMAADEAPARDLRALWVWGRLQDFERDGVLDLDPDQLVEMMSGHMKATTRRLAPLVAAWLERIGP
jgi:hypothetical protein